jgi:hypothetical protein
MCATGSIDLYPKKTKGRRARLSNKGIWHTPDGRLRCQGVTHNSTKRRFEFDLWVPRDVLALVLAAGGKNKTRTVFPQKLSEDEAHVQAAETYVRKQAEWNDLRNAAQPDHLASKLLPSVSPRTRDKAFVDWVEARLGVMFAGADHRGWSRDHATSPSMVPHDRREAVHALIDVWFERHDGHLGKLEEWLEARRDELHEPGTDLDAMTAHRKEGAAKAAPQQGADGKRFFDYEKVIPEWEHHRRKKGISTDKEKREAALRPLRRLHCSFRNSCSTCLSSTST